MAQNRRFRGGLCVLVLAGVVGLLFGSDGAPGVAVLDDVLSSLSAIWTTIHISPKQLSQQSLLTTPLSFRAPTPATRHDAGLGNRPRRPDHFFRRFTCAQNFEAVDSNSSRRCFLKADEDSGLPRHWIRVPGNGGAYLDSWGFVCGYLWWGHLGLWLSEPERKSAEPVPCPPFTTRESKNGITICTVRADMSCSPSCRNKSPSSILSLLFPGRPPLLSPTRTHCRSFSWTRTPQGQCHLSGFIPFVSGCGQAAAAAAAARVTAMDSSCVSDTA